MSSTPRHDGDLKGRASMPEIERVAVTLLYAPADRPPLVEKALLSDADLVVVDLEDAVAPAQKEDARHLAERLLGGDTPRSVRGVQVRINALDGPWGVADVAMLDALPPEVELRLPKVESAAGVREVRELLSRPRRLHCLLESACGVEHAYEIARSNEDVASIALGEADLRSELGPAPDLLAWARARVVMATRAAGLPAPMQSVWTAVRDLEGLASSCAVGRREGFVGRAAIHPGQLDVIRRSYRPEPKDVARAEEVLHHLREASVAGRGSVVTTDGDFVDVAMARGAASVLALERACRPMP